jgi:PhnB protein
MKTTPVRSGFSTVSPYLVFRDAAKALDFYARALGAEIVSRRADPDGTVRHAEFRLGDTTFMVTQETPAYAWMRSVEEHGGSPVHFFVYVREVDAPFERALAAGCTVVMPLAELPYGRSGGVRDPFGHVWWLSTHREQN